LSFQILIVDDNATIRRALRSLIESQTLHEVCGEAENGQIAIARVKELHPDVVILDLQMPVMNGLDAARQISILFPGTVMVMVTMHCSEQLRKDAEAVGILDVVSKYDEIAEHLLTSLDHIPARP
jgi:DNA-binding NarL/FixJ family response regulator